MTTASIKINDVEIGEVEIGTIEVHNEDLKHFDFPDINIDTSEIVTTMRVFKSNIERLMKQIAPYSAMANGYYIENKRGRNKLKEWK